MSRLRRKNVDEELRHVAADDLWCLWWGVIRGIRERGHSLAMIGIETVPTIWLLFFKAKESSDALRRAFVGAG